MNLLDLKILGVSNKQIFFSGVFAKYLILCTYSFHLNRGVIKESEIKNFKSQNNNGVSLNYRLGIIQRHTTIPPSFSENVIFICCH